MGETYQHYLFNYFNNIQYTCISGLLGMFNYCFTKVKTNILKYSACIVVKQYFMHLALHNHQAC